MPTDILSKSGVNNPALKLGSTEYISVEAKSYLNTKIYNPNIKVLRQELNILKNEKERLERLLKSQGRISLNEKNPIDWDDSDGKLGTVQASTIAFGHILNFKQVWRAAGYSLGDLLYSLPLAPGQKKQIAIFDWDRKETTSKSEKLDYRDNLQSSVVHDRDIQEIVNSNISENTSGSSHNKSKGKSAGIATSYGQGTSGGAAGSYGGFSLIGAVTNMAGISGGVNKSSGESWADASQSSMRSLSASSSQQLRDRTMQNASSLRSQRSTIISTVGQSESFKITTEVIANHNHCHAITIQYFEVLRHFALHQELADVQECLFIPMLIEEFDRKKILRWRDILSTYLFAPLDKLENYYCGFDALQRIDDDLSGDPDAYYDFPIARYCDETLSDISGDLRIKLNTVRPSHTLPTTTTAPTAIDIFNAINNAFKYGGLGWWGTKSSIIAQNLANAEAKHIEENFQKELEWADFPRAYLEGLRLYVTLHNSPNVKLDLGVDFSIVSQRNLGQSKNTVAKGLSNNNRFGEYEIILSINATTKTIAALTGVTRANLRSIVIENINELPLGSTCMIQSGGLKYNTDHYAGILFNSTSINNDIAAGDSALISTPLNKDEIRDPRKEDRKNADLLVKHLNAHNEYYHRILWIFLDEQRMFNLLDKYSISIPKLKFATGKNASNDEIYGLLLDSNGKPVIEYQTKSVASVVELKRVGMAGNSIIFPVTRGLNINEDFLLIPIYTIEDGISIGTEKNKKIGVIDDESRINLIDLYKPLPGTTLEPKPFRVSIPTKGLFAESVAGACNSCEKIDDSRFWKWEEHPIDDPTSIQPISTDTRRAEPLNLTAKDFPTPMINIQNAPSAPDPQGLANALMLMGKSDMFKDITGLDQTQKNALQAMLSNQDTAKYFADQATKMGIEAGKNTQHAADTVAAYDLAKKGQNMQMLDKIKDLPIDSDTKEKYIDDAVNKILGKDETIENAFEKATSGENKNEASQSIKDIADKVGTDNISKITSEGTDGSKITLVNRSNSSFTQPKWRVADSLQKLRAQINALAPNRNKSWDGTIGDPSHQTRDSDHNPWVMDGKIGVVTAMDITNDPTNGCDAALIVEAIRVAQDSRVKYLIWNSQIASKKLSWAWRPYNGQNPHDHHFHISVINEKSEYDDDSDWAI
jgi:hypothetical protein